MILLFSVCDSNLETDDSSIATQYLMDSHGYFDSAQSNLKFPLT
ncbi:hypothetical protein [Marinoscillum luteum]|uniref:Uncharacterized protein n=1 Tax=Marinoscillum luteum TaxID=861051 RepID=A0ABW7N9H3_9BACT